MTKWVLEEKQGVKYYRLEFDDTQYANLICLFFTRVGGLDFLLDQPMKFNDNLAWIRDNLRIKNINILKQIHSDKIYYVNENNYAKALFTGDGMFSDLPNNFLGIRVADCLPIYFFVPHTKIIGIVHSGWQGTIKKIGLKLTHMIHERFNIKYEQVNFAFGPSISSCCYEIKNDVSRAFEPLIEEYNINRAMLNRNNKIYLDLKQINCAILESIGLKKLADIKLCSYCNKDLFFSARRDNTMSRNLALIGYKT